MSDKLSYFEPRSKILCYYANVTHKVLVVRIANIPNWYFEKVLFPGQRLMFEALPEAVLEIHTGAVASAILSDKIPCYVLRVIEEVTAGAEQAVSEAACSAIGPRVNSNRPARAVAKAVINNSNGYIGIDINKLMNSSLARASSTV